MPDENLDLPEESGYGVVMPFVSVKSNGGPHDDQAYVCGYEMGLLDADLTRLAALDTDPRIDVARIEIRRTLQADNRAQADLIAMRHGFTMTVTNDEYAGWINVTFSKESE